MPGDTPPDSRYAAQVTFLSEKPKTLEKAGKAPKSPEQLENNLQHTHRSIGSTHGQMAERLWR